MFLKTLGEKIFRILTEIFLIKAQKIFWKNCYYESRTSYYIITKGLVKKYYYSYMLGLTHNFRPKYLLTIRCYSYLCQIIINLELYWDWNLWIWFHVDMIWSPINLNFWYFYFRVLKDYILIGYCSYFFWRKN